MHTAAVKQQPLITTVLAPMDLMRSVALIVTFSLLTALAAQIAIPTPWSDVPITGQTFAVLLTGALLGSRLGALAMIAYLAEGAAGLPFFSGGRGGVAHLLFSPTAGYLWAFPIAAFVTGYLAERGWDRRFLTAATAMAIGSLMILLGGLAWRMQFMPLGLAFATSVGPFLIGDAIKIALAAAILPSGWALLRKFSK